MTKIRVVAQAPYPVPVDQGRYLVPGEVSEVEQTPEVDSQIKLGMLRAVPVLPTTTEEPEASTTTRKPRATTARNENQEDT